MCRREYISHGEMAPIAYFRDAIRLQRLQMPPRQVEEQIFRQVRR